jgi:hypothetical protein
MKGKFIIYTVKYGKFGSETQEKQFSDLNAARHFAASKERLGNAVIITKKQMEIER